MSADDSLTSARTDVTASDSISLTIGSASISMKKDGTITIKARTSRSRVRARSTQGDSAIVMKGRRFFRTDRRPRPTSSEAVMNRMTCE